MEKDRDLNLEDVDRVYNLMKYALPTIKVFKYLNEYLQEKQPQKNYDEKIIYNALFIAKTGFTLLYPILPKISEEALNVIDTPLKPLKYTFLEESFYVKKFPILFSKRRS